MQSSYDIAVRLRTLAAARKAIEDEEATLKTLLLTQYPDIKDGVAPPFIKVTLRESVELDQAAAQAFFVKHKDLRSFFKLSLGKADFERIGNGKIGALKLSPVVQPDKKAIESTPSTQAA
ncbi:MAG: hypothetical protein ACK443_05790 [Methylococcaceae bacterium]|jgi:hypothetical protein